jgi:hypothetical protein
MVKTVRRQKMPETCMNAACLSVPRKRVEGEEAITQPGYLVGAGYCHFNRDSPRIAEFGQVSASSGQPLGTKTLETNRSGGARFSVKLPHRIFTVDKKTLRFCFVPKKTHQNAPKLKIPPNRTSAKVIKFEIYLRFLASIMACSLH